MTHDWFHAVADRLPEPVLLLSSRGTILGCNPPAWRALGDDLGGGELLGSELAALASDGQRFRRYLTLAARTGTPLPGSLRVNGSTAQWHCESSATLFEGEKLLVVQLSSGSRAVKRFLALNTQIELLQAEIRRRQLLEAERQQLLESERQAREAAEEASRFKDELLASISHELRTPLHAISGWLALIRENPGDRERLIRGLDVIERNIAAETQLTEDLVDTALVITGRMKLNIQPVNLEQVVRQAVESIRPTVTAKQQRLELIAAFESCEIHGDPDRLLQVVWNLLSNAAKYTPRGGEIRIALRRINSHVEISVSDTGQGIGSDLLPYVFDRFRRGDASSTRRHGGLGLGLAIARHLVELHGGVVMADSDGPGKGATFTVSLPLPVFRNPAVATSGRAEVEKRRDEGILSGLRVLLIEDHDDSREILSSILEARGAVIEAADCAVSAHKAFRERAPEIVISDIEMPDEDGFTLMRKLRDVERELQREPIPAIAVSAHNIGDARLHALRAGYQAFLSKPMNPAELVAIVASLCRRASAG